MGTQEIFGAVAGGLSLVAWAIYIVAILRGTTRPSRATWWILTLVGLMILATYYQGGARETVWVPVMYVVGPLIVALLSLKYGDGEKWQNLDKWCLWGSIFGALMWAIFDNALVGLVINIAVDLLGISLTIKKSYLDPYSEDVTAWTIEAIASLLNLVAVTTWALTWDSFGIWVYPVYMVIFNGLIAGLLIFGRWRNPKPVSE
jgi:hypothetical protein